MMSGPLLYMLPEHVRPHALHCCMQVLDLDSCGRRHWRILGCSAVTGTGLLQGFDWLLSDVQGRIQLL